MAEQQSPAPGKIDWHRLFGLFLMDYFTGSPYEVEAEKDLSLHQQLLDVVIIRKGKGKFHGRLPDGLDDLVAHNLVSFKSFQETLDAWAMKELVGHYVNYRKQLTGRNKPLLPEAQFHLYAVCCRYPHNLAQQVALQPAQEGVYDCLWGTDRIRVVAANQLPQSEHNAPLHLFSASGEQVEFGATHYRQRSSSTSTLMQQLFQGYQGEGVTMPYTLEDFERDWLKENARRLLDKMDPISRTEGLTPEQLVERLSTEELKRLLAQREAAEASKPEAPKKPGRSSSKRSTK